MKFSKIKGMCAVSLLVVLSACSVKPTPLTSQDYMARATQDMATLFKPEHAISGELSLPDAIARALMYNLDHRSLVMEQALRVAGADVSAYDLLPAVTAHAGYTDRSEVAATSRQDIDLSVPAESYRYSADRSTITADLTLSWHMLDFGVSYYNAKQNGDRALIAEERRRKGAHILVQNVLKAYWRAAAAQVLMPRVRMSILDTRAALRAAAGGRAGGGSASVDTLVLQRDLLKHLRELEAVRQDLSTARFELARLVHAKPDTPLRVRLPVQGSLIAPGWSASVDDMLTVAFINNPDLREAMYRQRIAVADTRKAMLSFLPGVGVGFGSQFDSNSYLDENRWYEFSTVLSWNILNLLSYPAQRDYAEVREQVLDTRRLALRMALMAQVHVAEQSYHSAVQVFEQRDMMYQVERQLGTRQARASRSADAGPLQRIAHNTMMIVSESQRYLAYADVLAAIAQIHATLGIGMIPGDADIADMADFSQAIEQAMADWQSGAAISHEVKALGIEGLPSQTLSSSDNAPDAASQGAAGQEPSGQDGASYMSVKLGQQPGDMVGRAVELLCASVVEDRQQDGWIYITGLGRQKTTQSGWVQSIYLMQSRMACPKP